MFPRRANCMMSSSSWVAGPADSMSRISTFRSSPVSFGAAAVAFPFSMTGDEWLVLFDSGLACDMLDPKAKILLHDSYAMDSNYLKKSRVILCGREAFIMRK